MNNGHKSVRNSLALLLTGVTGFLGGAFLANLVDDAFDEEVICLVRADDQDSAEERVSRSVGRFGHRPPLPKNVRILRGDLLSDDWHRAPELDRVTHVLHLAANTSFGNQGSVRRTNVEGALAVARAMRGRRLERYLYTGTAAICGASPPPLVREDDYPDPRVSHLVAYTQSKAEAERELAARFADLPLVIARPSIVVGDTRFGCKPSGSIFWVLRAVEALRFIAWPTANRVDVVPADWAAAALRHLLLAPRLEHRRYHVSAGEASAVTWEDLAAGYARICGGPRRGRYEVGGIGQLTRQRVKQAIGEGHARHLLQALDLYARFCSLDAVFDNRRLLAAGVPPPPRFTDYLRVCLESSTGGIYEQMRADMDASLVLV